MNPRWQGVLAGQTARGRIRAGAAVATGVAILVGLSSGVSGCTDRPLPPPVPIDCTGQNAYETWVLEEYDSGSTFGWYSYGDLTPGGDASATGVPIEDGGVPCGASPYALLLSSDGFHDYGSGFGTYAIGGYGNLQMDPAVCTLDGGATICPIDAGGWEGLRFWARSFDPSGAPTTKGFTLTINDKDTFATVEGADCVNYDAGLTGTGASVYLAPGTAMGAAGGGVPSAEPPPDACGNGFGQVLLTTGDWQLYNLPFNSFYQQAEPNRKSTGFDPTTFAQITIAVPKEAAFSLWIDDLGFYRPWPPEAGVEAGQ
jgi:hypothetical protein